MEVYNSHQCIFSLLASTKYSVVLKRLVIEHSPKEISILLIEACHNLLLHNLELSSEQKLVLVKARKVIRKISSEKRVKDLTNKTFIRILPVLLKLVKNRFSK